MRVFDFIDYKAFLRTRVESMPKHGRGQYQKIASHLNVHSTMISQVFGGDKNLSLEQACSLCEFLGLGDLETEFFVALVSRERAGSKSLKNLIDRRLDQLRRD